MNELIKNTPDYWKDMSAHKLAKILRERYISLAKDAEYHRKEIESKDCNYLIKELHEVSIAHIEALQEHIRGVEATLRVTVFPTTTVILENESVVKKSVSSKYPIEYIYNGAAKTISYSTLLERLSTLYIALKSKLADNLSEDGRFINHIDYSCDELDEIEMNYIAYSYTLLAMRNLASHSLTERFIIVYNGEKDTTQVYDNKGHLIFMSI